ncbi:histone deacetylase 8-like [Phlebotomus argentipes]|uniref:histone deacetylase 8-like n=1 Tax=Phlebotomus argentipes TaxID=94469 RepID=UPI002892CCF1|nr:histone deacetylase 8-like [Phlebotomus argentipes]
MAPTVALIHSEKLLEECDKIPNLLGRASMIYGLIEAYGLLHKVTVVRPRRASHEELLLCHSGNYLKHLEHCDGDEEETEEDEDFGLSYDCPKFSGVYKFAEVIAGGTISAAESLISGSRFAINWSGGWHHAQSDRADGFCYVNDIVVGIQRLVSHFPRILYLDLDVHHGDGVENAFSCTKRVFCLSFHLHEVGFFPGSGGVNECGFGPGKGYSANFPYKRNISGKRFRESFFRTTKLIKEQFDPSACVVQCGADILTGDPLGGANLTPRDMIECLNEVKSWNIPCLFVGGGGYNLPNAARHFALLTATICDAGELNDDIPEHDYFNSYGPGFELSIEPKNLPDSNTDAELETIYRAIEKNLLAYGVNADKKD